MFRGISHIYRVAQRKVEHKNHVDNLPVIVALSLQTPGLRSTENEDVIYNE